MKLKIYRDADPIIWGGYGGLLGAVMGTLALIFHALPDGQSVGGFIGGAFFTGWLMANVRNWLGSRR